MPKPQRRELETELKLILSPAGERRLEELAAFRPPRASRPQSERIVTTYFDTTNRDLARRGVSLRVRRAGEKRIQTVKAEGEAGVAKARGEWEWPLEKEEPDLGLAASTPVAEALPPEIDKQLEPIVVTDVVRTKRIVQLEGNTIEAALDSAPSRLATPTSRSMNSSSSSAREARLRFTVLRSRFTRLTRSRSKSKARLRAAIGLGRKARRTRTNPSLSRSTRKSTLPTACGTSSPTG